MNILHMKYAVEVADAGSISKAAQRLFVGQPNLSRAVRELETSLGITIFERSVKGMLPTPEGEIFLSYARKILGQIDEVENYYRAGHPGQQRFSISVPRASYISQAFARFSHSLADGPAELFYQETNSLQAIDNILHADYHLGIVRFAADYSRYYKALMEEKELAYERITSFCYVLIFHRQSPLAQKPEIYLRDLEPLVEIAHADPYVPSLPMAEVRRTELSPRVQRRIFVFERAGQFDLLSQNPQTYMWVSPVPKELLDRYDLVQRRCADNTREYRDVLIRRRSYTLTDLDRSFIHELRLSRDRNLKPWHP